ncbi:MAG: hypothetical protein C4589_07910 [Peptococcaceae bacterium]|nr:MAG: hypothetical protein C4589_07910 [Peptococcaceae bacterium]
MVGARPRKVPVPSRMPRAEKKGVSPAGLSHRYLALSGSCAPKCDQSGWYRERNLSSLKGRDFYFDQGKVIFATEFTENTENIKKKQSIRIFLICLRNKLFLLVNILFLYN